MTIKQQVTIDEVIALLEEIRTQDPLLCAAIVEQRFPCNDFTFDHPTIQCRAVDRTTSLLGILNGIFGADENGIGGICVELANYGSIWSFKRTKDACGKIIGKDNE